MEAKCAGTARYSIDVRLPGMLFGSVRRNPQLGGEMISFDASKASEMPGVRKVIALDDGVIVVATNSWYAELGSQAVDIEWGPAMYPDSTAEHYDLVSNSLTNDADASIFRNEGDVDEALAGARIISGEYRAPYLAHATMEPMNAVAWFSDGKLDIWAGNQYPTKAVVTGAELCDIARDDVRVHTTYMGCGFGRRLEMDFVETAVRAAQALEGTPVLVTWSREQDMTHDVYRPLAVANFRARVTDGRPDALEIKASSPPLHDSFALRDGGVPSGTADKTVINGLREQPYAIENYRVSGHPAPAAYLLPVGWWRAVAESQNGFFHESIMDELAYAAGVDPLQMRLDLLRDEPSKQVLRAVAEMSDWGTELPEGHARGVAFVLSSGAPTAQVVEIRSIDGMIEIVKACVAVDVGIALDPQNIEAQLQSALIFGLTAAKTGEISVSDGRVDQRNFNTYTIMRMHEVPEIETRIIESGDRIYGIGEAATPTAAPALGNAIFAATGQRIRQLPFDKFVSFA
jgi:isoquinoline 1-oxidoreductase beta subunit